MPANNPSSDFEVEQSPAQSEFVVEAQPHPSDFVVESAQPAISITGGPDWENQANQTIAAAERDFGPLSRQRKSEILSQYQAAGYGRSNAPTTYAQAGATVAQDNSALANFGAPIVQSIVGASETFRHPLDPAVRLAKMQRVGELTQATPGSSAATAGGYAGMGAAMAPMLVPGLGIAYGMAQGASQVANEAEQRRQQGYEVKTSDELKDMAVQASIYALFGKLAKGGTALTKPILTRLLGESASKALAPYIGTIGAGGVAQLGNNLSDRLTGVNPDKHPLEGVLPSAVAGGVAHGIAHLTGITRANTPAGNGEGAALPVPQEIPQTEKGGQNETQTQGRQEVLTPDASQLSQSGAAVSLPTAAAPVSMPADVRPLAPSPAGFSRAALERKITEHFDLYNDRTARDIQDDATLEGKNPYVFFSPDGKTFPGEVRQAFENNPNLRRVLSVTSDPAKAGGADLLGELGSDDYFDLIGRRAETAKARVGMALDFAKTSDDPQMQLLAAMHENLPPIKERVAQDVIDPKQMAVGTEFSWQGHKMQIVEDENGYRMLRDGEALPETPVDAIDKMPADKGSIVAGQEPSLPEGDFVVEGQPQETGIFGQPVISSSGIGGQQPMFHQPVDVPSEMKQLADQRIAAKFDPRATPAMFRQGSANLSAPIESAKTFVKDDIVPTAASAAKAVIDAKNDIQRTFAPQTGSDAARVAANITRESAATLAQRYDRASSALDSARKFFDRQLPKNNLKFIDAVEAGKPTGDAKTDAIAKTMRQMFDQRRDEVQKLGTGALNNFIENYFPHVWKDPEKATSILGQILGKRPLEGPKSFLKQRSLPTTADGIAAGLEPVSTNPVELTLLKIREMDRYILAHRLMQDLQARGLAKFVGVGQERPEGFGKINDKIATVFGPRTGAIKLPPSVGGSQVISPSDVEVIGRRIMGEYMAPEQVANVLNNYLSPGLRNKGYFRAWMGAGNVMNQAQLGLSAYHLGFTSLDASTSKFALALEQAVRGQPIKAIGSVLETPLAPFTNFIKGDRILKEWYAPGSQGEAIAKMVDAVRMAGGRARTDAAYRTDAFQAMTGAFRKGNVLGGLLRLPTGLLDLATKPIIEYIVPRQKLGIFADMARAELEKANPASSDEVRAALAKAWDSADNRMGQVVYDNLFWNRAAKDLSMASVRSLGWNLGTWRELGGGMIDFAKAGADVARLRKPEFTHRMAYTIALPVVAGLVGGVLNYAMTGQPPQELKDYYFPRTGGLDENGRPARVSLPSYMKDLFNLAEHPKKAALDKLHPLISTIADMLLNRDYYNTQIRNADAPIMKQAMQLAEFAGKQAIPFGIRGYQKQGERGESLTKRAASFIGITPAPSYLNQTDAEKYAQSLSQDQSPPTLKTQDQADKYQLESQIRSTLKKDQKAGNAMIQQAYAAGKINQMDVRRMRTQSRETPLQVTVKGLSAANALKVFSYEGTTDADRAEIQQIVRQHILGSKIMSPADKQAGYKVLNDWQSSHRKAG